jgi:hypothetical protein
MVLIKPWRSCVAALQQPFAQVRANEAGTAGYENATFRQHALAIRHGQQAAGCGLVIFVPPSSCL